MVRILHNIRIVLVETSHPGNIGSVARAMKTMGLSDLYLVNPSKKPDAKTISLAAGAADLIERATLVDTLDTALAECNLVIGASARSRTLSWPEIDPKQCALYSLHQAESGPVALVFGCERTGLSNLELQKCHYHVVIPTNPEYSSLNLAMAVQILSYEIRLAYLKSASESQISKIPNYPLVNELECFYQHLEEVLLHVGFIHPARPRQMMHQLRRLFTRARLENKELNILRGILTCIKKSPINSKK
ncbi:MAG: tRNA (cytosine(32)/uridine(32)-2'-O)-methyltransferase TrmJ [Candidatus Hamiltonella defensa (Ceratovacuna japonica)]|nr:tRNA (cytosine(32)/uridine(32)-2'-O)-methyltransferase TrmJ [Candidatus Hamiltonella defensa]